MRGAVELQLSDTAQGDLDEIGKLARRLLATTIRDRVLTLTAARPLSSAQVESITDSDWPIGRPLGEQTPGWHVLDVGDYEVVVRPLVEDGQIAGALVARVLPKGALAKLLAARPAAAGDGP